MSIPVILCGKIEGNIKGVSAAIAPAYDGQSFLPTTFLSRQM